MGKRSRKRTAPAGAVSTRRASAEANVTSARRGPGGAIRRAWEASAEPVPAPVTTPREKRPRDAGPHVGGAPDRRARLHELPQAPWSPFPLVELAILLGLILIVLGFLGVADRRGTFLVGGFLLVSLAGLELAVREHVAGFRSHSALLAGFGAVLLAIPLFLVTPLPQPVILVLCAVAFGVGFQALRGLFARRAGGLSFRA